MDSPSWYDTDCPCCGQHALRPACTPIPDVQLFWICEACDRVWDQQRAPDIRDVHNDYCFKDFTQEQGLKHCRSSIVFLQSLPLL